MNGKVYRYDDGAWGAVYPPNGYNCRCRVRAFSDSDIKRRGIDVASSDGKLKQVDVPLKGGGTAAVTRIVDKGLPGGKFQPDVGFSNNPAQTVWQPSLEAADVQLSRRYVDTAIQGPAFERFVSGKAPGAFPVAVLRQADRDALGTQAAVAYMSGETVAKQLDKHPEVTVDDYRRIPDMVDNGEVYQQAANRLIYLQDGDVVYRLALKATKPKDALFVLSLFKTTRAAADKEVASRMARVR